MKVIVVGAGAAGLSAIHTLEKNGVEVTAFEEKGMAGGRIASLWRDGFAMDLGAQFIFWDNHTYRELSRDVGLGDDITEYLFRGTMMKKGKLYTSVINNKPKVLWEYRKDMMSSQGFDAAGFLQLARFMPAFLKRRGDLDFIDFERALDLEDMTAAEFALGYGGEEVLEGFLQPVAANLTLGEPEDFGAGYALALVWGVLHGVSTLKKGFGSLAARLAEMHAGSIRLSTPVKRIVLDGKKARGVETADGFVEADAVVCATTATTALALMPDLPAGISGPLGRMGYSSCCHIMLALRNHLFPERWYGCAYPRREGRPFNLADNSVKSPYYAPEGCSLIHCFSFGRRSPELMAMEDGELLKFLVRDIQRDFPRMPDEPFFSEIYRWKEAVGQPKPGALKAILAMKRDSLTEMDGLHLAGEYMYMPSAEGALRSGIDAAEAVVSKG